MLELTHINENNDNLYYDKLIRIFKHFQENINTSDWVPQYIMWQCKL